MQIIFTPKLSYPRTVQIVGVCQHLRLKKKKFVRFFIVYLATLSCTSFQQIKQAVLWVKETTHLLYEAFPTMSVYLSHWDRPQLDLQFSCLVLPLSLSIHTYICNYIHVFRDITRSCRVNLHVTPIRRLGTFVE